MNNGQARNDQGIWDLNAYGPADLNRPFDYRVRNGNLVKLVQQPPNGCLLLLAEIRKTEDFNPRDCRIDDSNFRPFAGLLQYAHAVRQPRQRVNQDVAV